jgi:hypothetical protein
VCVCVHRVDLLGLCVRFSRRSIPYSHKNIRSTVGRFTLDDSFDEHQHDPWFRSSIGTEDDCNDDDKNNITDIELDSIFIDFPTLVE